MKHHTLTDELLARMIELEKQILDGYPLLPGQAIEYAELLALYADLMGEEINCG